jgi:hypothetical protein
MSSRPQTPFARPQLVCCLGSSSALALLALRAWAIALFETGAAPGIAPLYERRCEIVTAAVTADQLAVLLRLVAPNAVAGVHPSRLYLQLRASIWRRRFSFSRTP